METQDTPILFRCTKCNFEEYIPKEVVDFFDIMDGGDPSFQPKDFSALSYNTISFQFIAVS